MRLFAGMIVALALTGLSEASATIVEVPLPALYGTYPITLSNGERTATVQLSPMLAINSVSFRVSGTTAVGMVDCEGNVEPWGMDILASMFTDGSGIWMSSELMLMVSGAFAWTGTFRSSPPIGITWDFLLDGEAELILYGAPLILVGICTVIGPPPTADVTEATLIIDADFTVPTETGTWGQIKALYSGPN